MPSTLPLPTLTDYLQAARKRLRGERDRYADTHSGSMYDHLAGPVAVLLLRETDRDQDLFSDIYFADASSDALTNLIQGRWQIPRILDTYGQGTSTWSRSSAAAGAGTLWQGTRVQVPGTPPGVCQIAADYPVSATQVVATPTIEATVLGTGQAVTAGINSNLQLLDPLYDPLWLPQTLTCADGTDFEDAATYRARALALRLSLRNGYITRLTQICQQQGAKYVIFFASNYGLVQTDFTDDFGLNAIYVADANYQTPQSLITNCTLALEAVRVLGNDLQVGGVIQTPINITATVYLRDTPGRMDIIPVERSSTAALLSKFSKGTNFAYKLVELAAAMRAAAPSIQNVVFNAPGISADSPILLANKWPYQLPRYTLAPQNITLSLTGPQ